MHNPLLIILKKFVENNNKSHQFKSSQFIIDYYIFIQIRRFVKEPFNWCKKNSLIKKYKIIILVTFHSYF